MSADIADGSSGSYGSQYSVLVEYHFDDNTVVCDSRGNGNISGKWRKAARNFINSLQG